MKLVTWNVQWCRGADGRVDPKRIVEVALALLDGVDVLCFQEVASGYGRIAGRPGDQPAQLAALLPGWTLCFGAAVEEWDRDGRRRRFGNAIATRLPVARVERHALPWPADPAHNSMPRQATVVTLHDRRLGPVRVMTTHLEYYSPAQRAAQARALRAIHEAACAQAAAPPAPPEASEAHGPFQAKILTPELILCGDFNMPATDAAARAIERSGPHGRLRNAWPLLHRRAPQPPTFRAFDQSEGSAMACDLVFLSTGLAPHLRRIEVDTRTRASDHQPVAIELG